MIGIGRTQSAQQKILTGRVFPLFPVGFKALLLLNNLIYLLAMRYLRDTMAKIKLIKTTDFFLPQFAA